MARCAAVMWDVKIGWKFRKLCHVSAVLSKSMVNGIIRFKSVFCVRCFEAIYSLNIKANSNWISYFASPFRTKQWGRGKSFLQVKVKANEIFRVVSSARVFWKRWKKTNSPGYMTVWKVRIVASHKVHGLSSVLLRKPLKSVQFFSCAQKYRKKCT